MSISAQNRVCAFLCVAAVLILACCSGNNLNDEVGYNGTPSSTSVFSSSSGEAPPVVVPPSIFTVSFNIDGQITTIQLDSGTAALGDFPSDPERAGYTFDGWIDEASGIIYTATTPIIKNITLTTKWTIIEPGKAIVSFYTEGGIPSTIDPVKLDTGTTLGTSFPGDPERAGYTFGGWFDLEGVQYTATTKIVNNVALMAKWTIKSYRVTFSRSAPNATSPAIDPVSVDSGSTLGTKMPANPTRPDSVFAGWFAADGTEYTAESIITGELVLTAKWAAPGTLSSSSGGSSSGNGSSSSAHSSSSLIVIDPLSFKEKVGSLEFDMVYIPGGTFTLGCESGSCTGMPSPVQNVQVSNYFIGKTEVNEGLWKAVMGSGSSCLSYGGSNSTSCGNITWYRALEFACELSKKTGKNYRMLTEAEWEYAAKKHRSSLDKIGDGSIGSGEEWVYNSWNASNYYVNGPDPIGPKTIRNGVVTWGHTQKTRRDPGDVSDKITGRLIRSIDGFGPGLRLGLSKDVAYPPDMIPTCDIHAPVLGPEPKNSYRDPRWVTGDGKKWSNPEGAIAIGDIEIRAWEDGTARFCANSQCSNGQWFTSNNITFVFVSGSSVSRFPYIFLNEEEGSLISDKSTKFTYGGTTITIPSFVGRIAKEESNYAKPSVSGLKTGEALARDQADFNTYYKMVDMTNMPKSAQDERLLDGPNHGWFQDNTSQSAAHHYRKDIDAGEFRFTVNQGGGRTVISNGTWFTVNNTFLRVTKDGYTADYLYTITDNGTLYHNSFQGYERGDFRMFEKTANGGNFPCGSICSGEIPTGLPKSMYADRVDGQSTFKPAPVP